MPITSPPRGRVDSFLERNKRNKEKMLTRFLFNENLARNHPQMRNNIFVCTDLWRRPKVATQTQKSCSFFVNNIAHFPCITHHLQGLNRWAAGKWRTFNSPGILLFLKDLWNFCGTFEGFPQFLCRSSESLFRLAVIHYASIFFFQSVDIRWPSARHYWLRVHVEDRVSCCSVPSLRLLHENCACTF